MILALIVDDEPLVRLAVRTMADWGAMGIDLCAEAGNGREALDALAEHPGIGIAIVDVDMPEMDGLTLVEELANRKTPGLDVVMLSAYDDFDFARRAFKAGIVDYVLKSEMDDGRLITLLSAIVERRLKNGTSTEVVSTLKGGDTDRKAETDRLMSLLYAGEASMAAIPDNAFHSLRALPPFRPCFLRLRDFERALGRFGGDRAIFASTATELVRSNLYRRPSGEVLALAEDRYAILLGPASTEEASGLEGELRGAFDAYLGVEASLAVGPETATVRGLAAAWKEAESAFAIRSRIVVRARRRISERYADASLDLGDIAAYAEVSKNHLSWEFSRETGETISACIARTRVDAAKRLLIQTNLKIYEVAERTGFSNVETFCRSFLKITGKQPSSWRTP